MAALCLYAGALPLRASQTLLASGVVKVAWFGFFSHWVVFLNFGIICDLQISVLDSLSKISARITVRHHGLCLLNMFGAIIFAF